MSIAAALTACTTNAQNKTDKNNKTMKTIELDKQQFIEKVFDYESNPTTWKYEGTKPAIVDFYATWCRPCKMVAPILEELAEEYGDSIVIYKVDTDRQQELAVAFGIWARPTSARSSTRCCWAKSRLTPQTELESRIETIRCGKAPSEDILPQPHVGRVTHRRHTNRLYGADRRHTTERLYKHTY